MTNRDRTVQCLQAITEARVHTRAAMVILEAATGPVRTVRPAQAVLELTPTATPTQDPRTPPVASQGRRSE